MKGWHIILINLITVLMCLSVCCHGATAKAKGYVTVTIVAPEIVPEPNTVVYTEVGTTLQVVF